MMDFHIDISGQLDAASALHYAALAGLRFAGIILPMDGTDFARMASLAAQVRRFSLYANVEAWAGVELRHIPPALLPEAVKEAREAGASLVLVHGETLGDQVEQGTNFAAVEAGADILAHPGLIDDEAAAYAAEKGVALEFSACPRHAMTNAHVADVALRHGCTLVRGSSAAQAKDIVSRAYWPYILKGADVFGKDENGSRLVTLLRESEEKMVRKLMLR